MESFDPDSGQVYTETTSAQVGSMILKWPSFCRGRQQDPEKPWTNGEGCSSLKMMAARACVVEKDQFTPELLHDLEWPIARPIFLELMQRDLLSFNDFCTWTKIYPDRIPEQMGAYAIRINDPNVYDPDLPDGQPTAIPSVVSRIIKMDANMLTFLAIPMLKLDISDLMQLTKLKNLAGLMLCGCQPIAYPGDRTRQRLLTNWIGAAAAQKAFRRLKVLVVWHTFHTDAFLKATERLPALSLLGLIDCKELIEDQYNKESDQKWRQLCFPSSASEKLERWHHWKHHPENILHQRSERVEILKKLYRVSDDLHDRFQMDGFATLADQEAEYKMSGNAPPLDLLRPEPQLSILPGLSIDITFEGNYTDQCTTSWFHRVPGKENLDTAEHSQLVDTMLHHDKKRRVRDNRRVNMGSLLSGFS